MILCHRIITYFLRGAPFFGINSRRVEVNVLFPYLYIEVACF